MCNEDRRNCPLKIQTEALVAKTTYKRSIHGDWLNRLTHSIHPTPLHSFTILLTLLLPYKEAAFDFHFNRSGCELQRPKPLSIQLPLPQGQNLLQRGRLDKWEKSLLLLPQLNPALTMNQCPQTLPVAWDTQQCIKEKSKQTRKLSVLKSLQCLMTREKTTHQLTQWEDEGAITTAWIHKGRN